VLLRHIWKVQSRLKSTLEVRLISCGQFDTTKEVQGVGPWCPVQISTSHQHHRGPSSRRWLSILIFQRLALLEKPADAVSQPAKLVCFVNPTALCWCGDELYRWCPPRGDGLRLGHRYTCIDTSISISRHADCLLSASDQQHFEALGRLHTIQQTTGVPSRRSPHHYRPIPPSSSPSHHRQVAPAYLSFLSSSVILQNYLANTIIWYKSCTKVFRRIPGVVVRPKNVRGGKEASECWR
jgi:hypothetical protein